MRTVTLAEFHDELHSQGVKRIEDVAFRCPRCRTVQSGQSIINASGGKLTWKEAERRTGFACVGRVSGAGPHKNGSLPGNGCDWSLGGLFKLHTLEVIEDGRLRPCFELASPAEAQLLADTNSRISAQQKEKTLGAH